MILRTGKVALIATAVMAMVGCANAQEWEPLVKGDTLDGWTQRGGAARYEIKDGVITGTTTPEQKANAFLCTEKEYGNFELELEFKVDPGFNSGVQVRSQSLPEYKDGRVHGYQVEIDPSPRAWTGGIYDESRRGWLQDLKDNEEGRNAFKPGEWNKLHISFRGNHLRTRLNDVPTAELRDDMTPRGFIALQVHSTTSTRPLQVQWRNIRLIDWDKVAITHWQSDSPFGDYHGTFTDGSGNLVAQVWDKGDERFQVRFLDQFESRNVLAEAEGKGIAGGDVEFKGDSVTGRINAGTFTGQLKGKEFALKATKRESPTMGAKPPEGAVVLFDGTTLDGWQQINDKGASLWKIAENGSMEVVPNPAGHTNHETKETFGDVDLHLEFRTSFMPYARGQQRANSGVYVQGSYEIQVLDSYALPGADNECGGIYKVGQPRVNMAFPPLQWQTYDISFRAARWDGDKKTENARITVRHNGVLIHDNAELPDATGGARYKGEPNHPGPLMLQDHGNAIQFRNIWAKRPAAQ